MSGPPSKQEFTLDERVRYMVAEKIGGSPEAIRLEDDLLGDLGLDSLVLAELSAEVEEMAGVRIPGDELIDMVTVGDLIRLLERTMDTEK